MPQPIYPPSPPSSTTSITSIIHLRIRTVISYRGALTRGNTLLYLPRPIRDRIYHHILTSEPQYVNIEVLDKASFALPEVCTVDHIFHHEVTQQILRHTTFTIPSDAAIFNFFAWLNEFDCGVGYGLLTRLELVGLEMWEKDEFMANAARLLWRCPNVKTIRLVIDLRDLVFVVEDGVWKLDLDALMGKYDLESLTRMAGLERIELELVPLMALEKRLRRMKNESQEREGMRSRERGDKVRLENFWGLKEWLEERAVRGVGKLEVKCPSMDELFGQGGIAMNE
ncbi:hypothetical protein K458DRAFT_384413 [Lentithecium fluviatile CBS 122367]|uniref:F-box domain-containing protein n=1 Tax=Lentithecium fluviatile CBS 122367 TaxID=1168545 RepID=A0A6G1JHX4_9PLEO|nr:hypothetical protein K458DRAFT_384413 [Lentithecium fluviatile CBS 122367]